MRHLSRLAFLLALPLLAAFATGCAGPALSPAAPAPAPAADPALAYVNRVSQSSYTHYLRDLLYCRAGQNRRAGAHPGPQHHPARDALRAQLAAFGFATSIEHVVVDGVPADNVLAVHTGTTRPGEIYVLSAHYDSAGTPGADDDASGVAGMLEAARVFAGHRSAATVHFIAFDAEEIDANGSRGWVRKRPAANVKGMVTLDMIAYNHSGATHNRARLYARRPNDPWDTQLAAAVALYGPLPTTRYALPDEGDYWSFEQQGWQGCMLIEASDDLNPYYHKAKDAYGTANYLDLAFATKMTRGLVGHFAKVAGFS